MALHDETAMDERADGGPDGRPAHADLLGERELELGRKLIAGGQFPVDEARAMRR